MRLTATITRSAVVVGIGLGLTLGPIAGLALAKPPDSEQAAKRQTCLASGPDAVFVEDEDGSTTCYWQGGGKSNCDTNNICTGQDFHTPPPGPSIKNTRPGQAPSDGRSPVNTRPTLPGPTTPNSVITL